MCKRSGFDGNPPPRIYVRQEVVKDGALGPDGYLVYGDRATTGKVFAYCADHRPDSWKPKQKKVKRSSMETKLEVGESAIEHEARNLFNGNRELFKADGDWPNILELVRMLLESFSKCFVKPATAHRWLTRTWCWPWQEPAEDVVRREVKKLAINFPDIDRAMIADRVCARAQNMSKERLTAMFSEVVTPR